jgi:D-glycero-D-manno-heptose 1,7-bisphosphate phosphatase
VKVAFLDRDGTIVSDYPDDQWTTINQPQFLDGAVEALQGFQEKGFKLIIVTNQYLIGEGVITPNQYQQFTQKLLTNLTQAGVTLLDVFHCPHARDEGCRCLKPRPGLIESALARYPQIDINKSFLAGDSPTDIALADVFGLRSFSLGFASSSTNSTRVESLKDILLHL